MLIGQIPHRIELNRAEATSAVEEMKECLLAFDHDWWKTTTTKMIENCLSKKDVLQLANTHNITGLMKVEKPKKKDWIELLKQEVEASGHDEQETEDVDADDEDNE